MSKIRGKYYIKGEYIKTLEDVELFDLMNEQYLFWLDMNRYSNRTGKKYVVIEHFSINKRNYIRTQLN